NFSYLSPCSFVNEEYELVSILLFIQCIMFFHASLLMFKSKRLLFAMSQPDEQNDGASDCNQREDTLWLQSGCCLDIPTSRKQKWNPNEDGHQDDNRRKCQNQTLAGLPGLPHGAG